MRSVYLSILALVAGCFNPASNIQGVWVLYLDADSTSDFSSDCSENFRDAKCPVGEEPTDSGPWTFENETNVSDQILVVEIIGGEGSDAFLVVQGSIVPGTIAGGVASFSWPNTRDTTESRTHEEGYHYEFSTESKSDTTLTLDPKTNTGSVSGSSRSSQTWKETDEWDAFEVEVYSGSIPAQSYLDFDGGNSYNAYDEAECEDDECSLEIETRSSGASAFTATRTDYDGMDGSNALDAGQIND